MLMKILCALFRRRDIVIDGEIYLRRFFLTPTSWPVRILLHRIYRSDPDRALHDHPFDFTTLILRGGYTEILPGDGTRVLGPGAIRRNKAEHTHRVVLLAPTWSLLLVSRARRVWGFHTTKGWVDWRSYLGLPAAEADSPEDVIFTRASGQEP